MDVKLETLIIIILVCIIFYLFYITNYNRKLLKITSTIDDNNYYVQDKEDAQEAANLIAKIKEKLKLLLFHLEKSYPNDNRVKLLKKIIEKML